MINKIMPTKPIQSLYFGQTVSRSALSTSNAGKTVADRVTISKEANDSLLSCQSSSFQSKILKTDCTNTETLDHDISANKEKIDRISEKLVNKEFWKGIFQDLDEEETDTEKSSEAESTTNYDVIVKSDGSKVLLVTTEMCGMEITMSLELSKPTNLPTTDTPDDNVKNQQKLNGENDANSNDKVFSQLSLMGKNG